MWDFEGHLTARGATDASGNWGNSRNEYSYDANGLRLSQSTVGSTGTTSAKTSYLWNGDRLLEERDKDNVLLARYEHGQELGPLSMLRPADGWVFGWDSYGYVQTGLSSESLQNNQPLLVTKEGDLFVVSGRSIKDFLRQWQIENKLGYLYPEGIVTVDEIEKIREEYLKHLENPG